ncbi:MAG TPA: sulfotransferase [Rudaea sp.]
MRNPAILNTADLPADALSALRDAHAALKRGAALRAERALVIAMALAPAHPEPPLQLGLLLLRSGRASEAVGPLTQAVERSPGEPDLLVALAKAQEEAGLLPEAIATMRRLVAHRPGVATLFNLGRLLDRHGELEEALAVMKRVIAIDPDLAPARLQIARNSNYVGDTQTAVAEFRKLIASGKELASAWYGLAEMKTVRFSADEVQILRAFAPSVRGLERAAVLHALGKALEDIDDNAAAFAAFCEAAELERAATPWDADAFARHVSSVRSAFKSVSAPDANIGSEVLFIVGMPRSGSTLVEQILAAHPKVEGGSELPDLDLVLRAESARRGKPLPAWVDAASASDWRRLGEDYLARTARWRVRKPRFTDKFPGNWLFAEAVLAMLPGARIIDCRRDPVETCWSCFRHFFAPGRAAWSCSFDDLAAYWSACTAYGDDLARRFPGRVRVQRYESLIDDPQAQVRELLAFCGLDFDAACLRPHQAERTIRTASAAQVRQPMARGETAAERYGALLDPLRRALGCG